MISNNDAKSMAHVFKLVMDSVDSAENPRKLNDAYKAVAAAYGFKNWQTMTSTLSNEGGLTSKEILNNIAIQNVQKTEEKPVVSEKQEEKKPEFTLDAIYRVCIDGVDKWGRMPCMTIKYDNQSIMIYRSNSFSYLNDELFRYQFNQSLIDKFLQDLGHPNVKKPVFFQYQQKDSIRILVCINPLQKTITFMTLGIRENLLGHHGGMADVAILKESARWAGVHLCLYRKANPFQLNFADLLYQRIMVSKQLLGDSDFLLSTPPVIVVPDFVMFKHQILEYNKIFIRGEHPFIVEREHWQTYEDFTISILSLNGICFHVFSPKNESDYQGCYYNMVSRIHIQYHNPRPQIIFDARTYHGDDISVYEFIRSTQPSKNHCFLISGSQPDFSIRSMEFN